MTDFIIGAIVLLIVVVAVLYIRKQKKSGAKCIGCSAGGGCAKKKDGSVCNCHKDE